MKVDIFGRDIPLNKREVRIAKRISASFLKRAREEGEKRKLPTFYFTVLIVMHVMTEEFLSTINPDDLQRMMGAFVGISEKEPGAEGSKK